jgi:SAM-dependent methyltransferase
VIGVDANGRALEAARVRGRGHELAEPRLRFVRTTPGEPLPFDDASMDLVVTVSVLEFISRAAHRDAVVEDLRRLVRPGGYLFIATPWPRLREHHSRFWLGDMRRLDGIPWASPPWHTRRWGHGWERIDVGGHLAARVRWLPARLHPIASRVTPYIGAWQKLLFRRPW